MSPTIVTSLTDQLNEFNLCGLLAFGLNQYQQPVPLLEDSKPRHMMRINSGMKRDTMTLLLHSFHGCCQFSDQIWYSDNDLEVFKDNAKLTGGGINLCS